MSFQWETRPDVVFTEGTDAYIAAIRDAIAAVLLRYAPEIETYLKTTAPWTDRTGNLRQSLWADAWQLAGDYALVFDYGLDYGVFLELANSGRYAVIAPALDVFAPRVWADIKGLFE